MFGDIIYDTMAHRMNNRGTNWARNCMNFRLKPKKVPKYKSSLCK